jgi:hypothetical protein
VFRADQQHVMGPRALAWARTLLTCAQQFVQQPDMPTYSPNPKPMVVLIWAWAAGRAVRLCMRSQPVSPTPTMA